MGHLSAFRPNPMCRVGVPGVVSKRMAQFFDFFKNLRPWDNLGSSYKQPVSTDWTGKRWKKGLTPKTSWRFHRVYESCQGANCPNSTKCCQGAQRSESRPWWRCCGLELVEWCLKSSKIVRIWSPIFNSVTCQNKSYFTIEKKDLLSFQKGWHLFSFRGLSLMV